jgi:hypothetical protein
MATNRTAAPMRKLLPVPFTITILVFGLALGGCESSSNLLGGVNQPVTAVADPQPSKTVSVAIAPVLGVPDATSKQMVAQVGSGLDKQRFTLVTSATTPADYTLRGYATASKDKTAGKLSYFFDVVDKSGKKINRIAGEEALAAPATGKDIWQSVTPAIAQSVATKTATSFAASIPAAGPPSAGAAIASTTPQPAAVGAEKAVADRTDVATTAAVRTTTTGSIDKPMSTMAVVPNVVGAPGDGSQSLSAALQKELTKSGVALSDGSSGPAYRVEGKVVIGGEKEGKQPIEISWNVKDPQGKKLGTVTQKNEIPNGSLDGSWGKTADAAAAAAAQGILKLLPGTETAQVQ